MKNQNDTICTKILLAANVVYFLILSFGGMTEDGMYLLERGASFGPYVVERKEYYRLFVSMFMHFDITHLLNNMITLGVVGTNVEPIIGKVRFVIVYLVSGLFGNIISVIGEMKTGDYAISAGASGAVFGLTGALLMLVIMNKGRLGSITKRGMLFMVGLNIYMGLVSEGVDNLAHMGGLVGGMLLTFLMAPRPKRREVEELR